MRLNLREFIAGTVGGLCAGVISQRSPQHIREDRRRDGGAQEAGQELVERAGVVRPGELVIRIEENP